VAPSIERVGDLTVAVERPESASSPPKPPVLLIHGIFSGAWQWEGFQGLLARHGFESHAVNLRGRAGSRPVGDIGRVRVRDYVDDALEVARRLGNPIVIGHSMGGLIAQKVAETGIARALVLISSAPPRWIPALNRILLSRLVKYLKELLLFRPLLPTRPDADVLIFNRTPRAHADAEYRLLVPDSGRAGFELAFGVESVHAPRITAPVRVVGGRDDHFVAPRVARALAAKYGASLELYDGFAHHIITEPGWDGPASEIVEWLDARLGASTPPRPTA
jgi:pimeloyl-ACP methyl ester carboxylesterase